MNKDIKNKIALCPIIDPVAITATTTSDLVDLQNFESVAIVVQIGAGSFDGSNYLTYKLQEADVTTGTSFTDVATADLVGSFSVVNGTAADANSIQRVGYIGDARYIRLVATETGTVSSVISATAVLGNARELPASDIAVTAAT
jgi:hypothetical protein